MTPPLSPHSSASFLLAVLWVVRRHKLLLVRFAVRLQFESMVLPYPQRGEGGLSSLQRDTSVGVHRRLVAQ